MTELNRISMTIDRVKRLLGAGGPGGFQSMPMSRAPRGLLSRLRSPRPRQY